ncbi:MAG: RNA-guided pseudouridylation complex pseudouridine synthase subunit Cbf5 [Candidatus Woesearchaeota archaeon]
MLLENELLRINREIFVKSKELPNLGKYPDERSVEELLNSGIIIIDKPEGPTSHQVSSFVRDLLNVKCGHSGTLDPKVSGVLPIALGKGTRLLKYLLNARKEYVGIMHLHSYVAKESLEKTKQSFIGKIEQIPPVKASVKREKRVREIYYWNFIEIIEKDVLFRVGVEKGTYIRKLCHDFGIALGTKAHMVQLRRTKVGLFDEKFAVTLHDLKDAIFFYKNENNPSLLKRIILPVEFMVQHLPKIWVKDDVVYYLTHGNHLFVPGIVKMTNDIRLNESVAVFTLKNELICVGIAQMSFEQIINSSRGLALKNDTVIMDSDYFPKISKKTS